MRASSAGGCDANPHGIEEPMKMERDIKNRSKGNTEMQLSFQLILAVQGATTQKRLRRSFIG
jgi:hypothetical protein